MTVYEIPLNNRNGRAFRHSVNLSGTLYILEFRFNTRAGYWIMDMFDFGKLPVINGVVLSVNIDLLANCSSDIKPEGVLMLIDSSGNNAPCTAADLGGRCVLVYIVNDE